MLMAFFLWMDGHIPNQLQKKIPTPRDHTTNCTLALDGPEHDVADQLLV